MTAPTAVQSKIVPVVAQQGPPAAHTGQQFVVTQAKGGTSIIQTAPGGPGSHAGGGAQQYIVTTVSQGGATSQNNDHHVTTNQGAAYPTAIQYTLDGAEPGIYTNGQANVQYDYTPSASIYTPVSSYHYNAGGQQTLAQIGVPGIAGQMVHQSGGHTYVIHSGIGMDGEGHSLSHATRASPATVSRDVQWLLDNYETAEGVSLPRSTLYNHYLRHCQDHKLDPMNPASFGKLIRSVFLGLRTRRLGTRGNSKYHYYGIRIKASSPLNQLVPDETAVAMRQPAQPQKRVIKPNMVTEGGEGNHSQKSMDGSSSTMSEAATTSGGGGSGQQQQPQSQHHQFLGSPPSDAVPAMEVEYSGLSLPDGVAVEQLRTFEQLYREHCEAIMDVVINLQFSVIEALWQAFWRKPATELSTVELDKHLSKDVLFTLAKWEPVQKFVRKSDYAFYQTLVEVLIPDVLRPIPSSLTQAVRNFAKSLEGWLRSAMQGVPEEMLRSKLGAVVALSQTLRRYTSLNHLAQAARAVLQNPAQITQMLSDLNRVDFANVQEQASWVCQCDDATVSQLEQDFKRTLQQQQTLEEWADWLEEVVGDVLKSHENTPEYPRAARLFLLKWSFYSSMVIRDLTLRSAASFGSFHLIRLLFDEFMFYIVEHRVASATGDSPIAVMGEVRQLNDTGSVLLMGSYADASEAALPSPAPAAKLPANTTPAAAPGAAPAPQQAAIAAPDRKVTPGPIALLTQPVVGSGTVIASAAAGLGKTIVVLPAAAAAGAPDAAAAAAAAVHAAKKVKLTI